MNYLPFRPSPPGTLWRVSLQRLPAPGHEAPPSEMYGIYPASTPLEALQRICWQAQALGHIPHGPHLWSVEDATPEALPRSVELTVEECDCTDCCDCG